MNDCFDVTQGTFRKQENLVRTHRKNQLYRIKSQNKEDNSLTHRIKSQKKSMCNFPSDFPSKVIAFFSKQ